MEQIAVYLLMAQNLLKLKQKIKATSSCLRKVSKDFSVDNFNKTELNGYAYDFSVDYGAIVVDDTLDIHKCLMKKHGRVLKNCLVPLKNVYRRNESSVIKNVMR